MNLLYAFRYFQVVPVVPPLFIGGFVVAVGAAAARLTTDPSAAADALTPVLLLQMFAASSGFQIPARRGHYDLLLTSGTPRWQVALAHCVSSIAPGMLGWVCVGTLEMTASHGARFASASQGTCVAFIAVSLIAWAAATPVSRAVAAVGWLLAMTIPPLARLISPVQLLGAERIPLAAAWLLAAIAIASCAGAFVRILRAPVPLEAAQ